MCAKGMLDSLTASRNSQATQGPKPLTDSGLLASLGTFVPPQSDIPSRALSATHCPHSPPTLSLQSCWSANACSHSPGRTVPSTTSASLCHSHSQRIPSSQPTNAASSRSGAPLAHSTVATEWVYLPRSTSQRGLWALPTPSPLCACATSP